MATEKTEASKAIKPPKAKAKPKVKAKPKMTSKKPRIKATEDNTVPIVAIKVGPKRSTRPPTSRFIAKLTAPPIM